MQLPTTLPDLSFPHANGGSALGGLLLVCFRSTGATSDVLPMAWIGRKRPLR
jgi:hypothetical protein